jgi:Concanavalin A-like lectin/glucanases superfamily/Regulator of chromosome condensation (RCC1) repeat
MRVQWSLATIIPALCVALAFTPGTAALAAPANSTGPAAPAVAAATVAAAGAYASAVLADAPAAYWPLDDGTAATAARDASGHGWTLGVPGGVHPVPGAPVRADRRPARPLSRRRRLERGGVGEPRRAAPVGQHRPDRDGAGGIGLRIGSPGVGVGAHLVGVVGQTVVDSGLALPAARRWYHVVMTDDGSHVRFAVDGRPTPRWGVAAPAGAARGVAIGRGLAGAVEEVAVYATPLSAATITRHYRTVFPAQVMAPSQARHLSVPRPAPAVSVRAQHAAGAPVPARPAPAGPLPAPGWAATPVAAGYGELGNGGTTNSFDPVQVSGLTGIVAVAGGWGHSLALDSAGNVFACAWSKGRDVGTYYFYYFYQFNGNGCERLVVYGKDPDPRDPAGSPNRGVITTYDRKGTATYPPGTW